MGGLTVVSRDRPPVGTRNTLQIDGTRLSYVEAGESTARPIVLCHGGGFDAALVSWRDVLPELAERYHVFAPDWPGFGHSDPPTETPSIAYFVDVLETFRETLELGAVVLCGVSLGGAVAIGHALEYPEYVTQLIAIDSYGLGSHIPGGNCSTALVSTPVFDWLWNAIETSDYLAQASLGLAVHPSNETQALREDVLNELDREDATETWQAIQRTELRDGSYQTDYREQLPSLSVPVLYVHGQQDRLIPYSWAKRAQRLTPDSELAVLSPCGHWTPRERPEALLEALSRFLDGSHGDRGE